MLLSLPEIVSDKKIRVDFDAPDLSSNGGLLLVGDMRNSLAWKVGQIIPDTRKQKFVLHCASILRSVLQQAVLPHNFYSLSSQGVADIFYAS